MKKLLTLLALLCMSSAQPTNFTKKFLLNFIGNYTLRSVCSKRLSSYNILPSAQLALINSGIAKISSETCNQVGIKNFWKKALIENASIAAANYLVTESKLFSSACVLANTIPAGCLGLLKQTFKN